MSSNQMFVVVFAKNGQFPIDPVPVSYDADRRCFVMENLTHASVCQVIQLKTAQLSGISFVTIGESGGKVDLCV